MHDAAKIRVLWDKGRNMFASFFTEVDAVRKRIGDDRLADWCFEELHISLSVIARASALLKKIDAARVNSELAAARKIEREKQKAKPEEVRKMRADRKAPPPDAARTGDVARLRAENARLTEEIERLKLARSKAGRKPIGDRPMTAAERMARMRAKRY